MLKVLISPNSFKECADSVTISRYMEESIRSIAYDRYKIEIDALVRPISDGGDGFLSVCRENFGVEIRSYEITAPWHKSSINCQIGYSEKLETVFIESANVLGLNVIPFEKRHPLLLSSAGMGDLIRHLISEYNHKQLKFSKVIIGIGGTGTSDFGLGMCSKLGLKLLDENSNQVEPLPANFNKIWDLVWERHSLPFEIEVVLDVNIPLLGENGAVRTFAPQKGATKDEIEFLEDGLTNYVMVLNRKYPENAGKTLYGAGGGLAAAFHYFFDATYKFSEAFIREDLQITSKNLAADLILTGEGSFDAQSLLKKGAMIVIDEFKDTDIPLFICSGQIEKTDALSSYKDLFYIDISKFFQSKEESIAGIRKGIYLAVDSALKEYFSK